MKVSKKLFSIIMVLGLVLFSYSALAATYVGSINSNKYHYTSCQAAKKIRSYNKIYFSSKEEARNSGYIPCHIC